VRLGIGLGDLRTSTPHASSALVGATTLALTAAVGFELSHRGHTTLDLQVRGGTTPFMGTDGNPLPVAALLGVGWR